LNYTAKEIILSWSDVSTLITKISHELQTKILSNSLLDYEIIAIGNGGIIPATILSYKLEIKPINIFPIMDKKVISHKLPTLDPNKKYFLVDEIYDTGKTIALVESYLMKINCLKIFLLRRYNTDLLNSNNEVYGKILNDSRWVIFPWEDKEQDQENPL